MRQAVAPFPQRIVADPLLVDNVRPAPEKVRRTLWNLADIQRQCALS
jgi:hypothetical protein